MPFSKKDKIRAVIPPALPPRIVLTMAMPIASASPSLDIDNWKKIFKNVSFCNIFLKNHKLNGHLPEILH